MPPQAPEAVLTSTHNPYALGKDKKTVTVIQRKIVIFIATRVAVMILHRFVHVMKEATLLVHVRPVTGDIDCCVKLEVPNVLRVEVAAQSGYSEGCYLICDFIKLLTEERC